MLGYEFDKVKADRFLKAANELVRNINESNLLEKYEPPTNQNALTEPIIRIMIQKIRQCINITDGPKSHIKVPNEGEIKDGTPPEPLGDLADTATSKHCIRYLCNYFSNDITLGDLHKHLHKSDGTPPIPTAPPATEFYMLWHCEKGTESKFAVGVYTDLILANKYRNENPDILYSIQEITINETL